ncbi:hypothetical protein R1sor_023532 [Riccia sorocarpa]|uniref:Uncharacterized protein n=1 Tax=Riccia sorocarpa TaxID=122646 RepID=A0ABD3GRY0_9MARC
MRGDERGWRLSGEQKQKNVVKRTVKYSRSAGVTNEWGRERNMMSGTPGSAQKQDEHHHHHHHHREAQHNEGGWRLSGERQQKNAAKEP